MAKRIKYLPVLLFVCLLFGQIKLYGQVQGNYGILKSALIVKFADNITWPNEGQIRIFNIGILGSDTAVYDNLLNISLKSKIKNKSFKIRWLSNLENIGDLHILYADKKYADNLQNVYQAIENKNILLISELSTDTKNIMMNILHDEKRKRLAFEVNKANIIIENLEMNPEVLLLAGTEVDIRELYRDIKNQFDEEKANVEKQKLMLAEQLTEIQNQRRRMSANDLEIVTLKNNIDQLTSEIGSKEQELGRLSDEINKHQQFLDQREQQLAEQQNRSRKQEEELQAQRRKIRAGMKELDSLILEGEKQRTIISDQTNTLINKEETINRQLKIIFIIVALGLIFGILTILIFRIYKSKQELSNKLEKSYATLRQQHQSILQLNEELNTINEMLEEKVSERTQILEERNAQLTEYAFINSHLLRAPLSQILGLSNLLTHENLNVKHKEIVEALSKSTSELDKIIRKISDLLYDGKDFSREEIESLISRKFDNSSKNN